MSEPPKNADPPPPGEWDDLSDTHPITVVPLDAQEAELVPCLIVISGRQMGQVFRLTRREARIGRAEDAELCVRDTSISRHHALVYLDAAGRSHIRDLGSTNGTFVNGKRVQDVELAAGDRLQLGNQTILKLEYHGQFEKAFHAQLYEAGTRDPLTDTYNRRYIDQHLEADFSLAVRHREELSLLMVDIDHFKAVNDTHGHLAGDAVLRALGRILGSRVRGEDILARYGGEEFLLVLRRTPANGAQALAESLRRLIEHAQFRFKNETIELTISVGIATQGPETSFPTVAALIGAADQALYRAKHAGRNRVEVFTLGGEEPTG